MTSSILTSTGKWFDVLKPDPSQIDFQDRSGRIPAIHITSTPVTRASTLRSDRAAPRVLLERNQR